MIVVATTRSKRAHEALPALPNADALHSRPTSILMTRPPHLIAPLTALNFPSDTPLRLPHLCHWLEDRHIRQLATEDRGPLRAEQPEALRSYLLELNASDELIEVASAGDANFRVCTWLCSLALHYAYGDNKDAIETKAAAASSSSTASDLLAADDADVLGLAAALGITPGATATDTLQAAVKAARQRPRPAPPPAAPPPKRPATSPAASAADSAAARAPRASRVPLAGLGEAAFPLGFETGGSEALDAACRVLRMLHVQHLRRLQDSVNSAIVSMQEYTANPRTDARLGRVGR